MTALRQESWNGLTGTLMLALKQDCFDVAYQPIYSARDRCAPVAYEALLRVEALPPFFVLSLARKMNLLSQLETKVLQRILAESAAMPRERIIFVNASRDALADAEWLDTLRRFGHGLVVEVQERSLREDELKALFRCKEQGIGIAFDDLGQTLDDLAALERVRPDYVKTDRLLVRDGDSDALKQIRGIAHSLGAKLVVEGIETEEQDWLYGQNADLVQGYYYARPHTIEEVI